MVRASSALTTACDQLMSPSETIDTDLRLDRIRVRGARTHNLQSIDVDLPHGRLIVVTGPSGSGKSSLVFDTIHAEGRRQYLETVSITARQLIHQLERPDVDRIDGLQPAICIDQNVRSAGPRETVGTLTEVDHYLRILFSRFGEPRCPECDTPIHQRSVEEIETLVMQHPEGTRLMVLAAPPPTDPRTPREILTGARRAGFLRVRIDGETVEVEEAAPRIDDVERIEIVVDRLIVRPDIESRLYESLQLAAEQAAGHVVVSLRMPDRSWRDERYATTPSCPECGFAFQALEPRAFNFNSPYGACSTCQGLGTVEAFDAELVIPRRDRSLTANAIAPWSSGRPGNAESPFGDGLEQAIRFLETLGYSADTRLSELPERIVERLLHGSRRPRFDGVMVLLEQAYVTCTDAAQLKELDRFRSPLPCPECRGSRLGIAGRTVCLDGVTLADTSRMTPSALSRWLGELRWPAPIEAVARPLVDAIEHRLDFLRQVGLDYLTIGRAAPTLSGGEYQRVRLATGIGGGLSGACYILDEPSIGLHPQDNERLIQSLKKLQQQGNTLLVVEHDTAIMRAADWIVDLGPGAGPSGGRVVAQGTPEQVSHVEQSTTGSALRGDHLPEQPVRRPIDPDRTVRLEGATLHNLQSVDLVLPLNVLVGISGVSGSGKSSLIEQTLVPAIWRRLGRKAVRPGPFRSLKGVEPGRVERAVAVDQTPIGRSARSNPATFADVFDLIRQLFAETKSARQRGYGPSRFSFNVKGGRCEACRGLGVQRIDMDFLADLQLPCNACHGRRYNAQTLDVRYRGKTIAEVLELTVGEAVSFFSEHPSIAGPLQCLADVGLDYLTLGQPGDTLSGGEAQRVKLASEIGKPARRPTLYLLDEPTTGLHAADVQRLVAALQRLVDLGHSVVVIEHHVDLLAAVDWLIDLGPGAGNRGGRIVAQGTPEQVAANRQSVTGKFLGAGG